jgi:hypothetical protein
MELPSHIIAQVSENIDDTRNLKNVSKKYYQTVAAADARKMEQFFDDILLLDNIVLFERYGGDPHMIVYLYCLYPEEFTNYMYRPAGLGRSVGLGWSVREDRPVGLGWSVRQDQIVGSTHSRRHLFKMLYQQVLEIPQEMYFEMIAGPRKGKMGPTLKYCILEIPLIILLNDGEVMLVVELLDHLKQGIDGTNVRVFEKHIELSQFFKVDERKLFLAYNEVYGIYQKSPVIKITHIERLAFPDFFSSDMDILHKDVDMRYSLEIKQSAILFHWFDFYIGKEDWLEDNLRYYILRRGVNELGLGKPVGEYECRLIADVITEGRNEILYSSAALILNSAAGISLELFEDVIDVINSLRFVNIVYRTGEEQYITIDRIKLSGLIEIKGRKEDTKDIISRLYDEGYITLEKYMVLMLHKMYIPDHDFMLSGNVLYDLDELTGDIVNWEVDPTIKELEELIQWILHKDGLNTLLKFSDISQMVVKLRAWELLPLFDGKFGSENGDYKFIGYPITSSLDLSRVNKFMIEYAKVYDIYKSGILEVYKTTFICNHFTPDIYSDQLSTALLPVKLPKYDPGKHTNLFTSSLNELIKRKAIMYT